MESETRLHDGRYIVRGVLGEGAQGVTYEALDTQTQRLVAIKRFDVRGAKSWKDVELAERETRVLASLDHPLVPRYIEHFENEGALYLVMEKVEGETLDAIRRREGALPEAEVRRFLASADRALSYLHGRGSPVVHRDIKPRNVVRRPDGSYVLVDFGAVAELLIRRGSSTVVGTMGYMAPEQFQGRAMPATDVYAVGATALAALTGVEPESLPHKGLHIDVRGALKGRASPELISSIEHMVEPDPERRAPSLAAALDGRHPRSFSQPPQPMPAMVRVDPGAQSNEDGLVKSIRALLWTLWGLGWVLVPVILHQLNASRGIPVVMFGSLALLLIVTWHKGAVIRAAVRKFRGDARADLSELRQPEVRQRVQVASVAPSPDQIRVRSADLSPHELISDTEVESSESSAQKRRQR